ncbi:hypothetical protein [Streptomyces sp. G-G2]|uniref:hypothetical protein n=1 Tax=Streptomyces sp. G-G2 TaxID=3046201 RepID=UPI0024B99289|nr:hypothetical protein [Streptomyces sp. G-G2]MDJ0383597.1 hypothetical protein [Streptomyces sp. G-G2]
MTERSAPGYHLTELGESRWYGDEDAADRIAGAGQVSAEYGALIHRLTERWGDPQVFHLGSLLERVVAGEEVAEPWGEMSGTTDHVHLWRTGDRWVVVYAAEWGADHSPQLMAAVTVIDPP